MRASGSSESLCRKAREYYYDLLCHNDGMVPDAIVRHVEGCSLCRQQIECLRAALSETQDQAEEADPSGPSKDDATLDALNRHFGLLDECVTCSHVRPFLPELLVPAPEIRIPTPVTVHVEHCPQCEGDLASLSEQHLTAAQLKKLSRFYGRSVACGPAECRSARPAAAALAAFSFGDADARTLNHVAACARCRARVYRHRARAMDDLHAGAGREGGLACTSILASDLFDWVVPLDLEEEAIRGTDERRAAIAAHARACRQCMEKAQSLHRTVYALAGRADSDTSTICRTMGDAEDPADPVEGGLGVPNASSRVGEGTETPAAKECGWDPTPTQDSALGTPVPLCEGAETVYRYPIRVEVLRRETGSVTGYARAAGRRLAGAVFRSSAGVASAVTAVVLVMGVFLMNAGTASGTIAGEILDAWDRAANVHIVKFHRDDLRPVQEIWMARTLNVLAIEDSDKRTVYDFDKWSMTVTGPGVKDPGPVRLTRDQYDAGKGFMTRANVLPELFADAELRPVENGVSAPAAASLAGYERTWTSQSPRGMIVLHRLRVLVDRATQLPLRTESSRKNGEQAWELITTTVFDYPDDHDMEGVFKARSRAE